MRYKIEGYREVNDLVFTVDRLIKEGWEPIGGVAHTGNAYIQALIKKEPATPPRKRGRPPAGAKKKTVAKKERPITGADFS
jgi:hypothetical protein